MLLPSALDCAPGIQPMRSVYSTTRAILSPPPHPHDQLSGHQTTSNIHSTCRALQSLLTNTFASPLNPTKPSPAPLSLALASPIELNSTNRAPSRKPSQKPPHRAAPTKPPQTPPPPSRKRRRSSSEDSSPPTHPSHPSTPKRQRLYPPTLPLGLTYTDFTTLQDEAASIPIPRTPTPKPSPHEPQQSSPHPPHEPSLHSPQTNTLITLLLHKLRLRQTDWDECARQLGNGRDSIGERFSILLGERDQEAGLRRGSGRKRRGSIGGVEFGGPLVLRPS